jgi:hypothetical protein
LNTIVVITPESEQMTESDVAEALRGNVEAIFQAAMHRLVDVGTVRHKNTIPCSISNPYYPGPPCLSTLRINKDSTAEQYAELFRERFPAIESADLVLLSVTKDNFPI